jgi:hypothetical protein
VRHVDNLPLQVGEVHSELAALRRELAAATQQLAAQQAATDSRAEQLQVRAPHVVVAVLRASAVCVWRLAHVLAQPLLIATRPHRPCLLLPP